MSTHVGGLYLPVLPGLKPSDSADPLLVVFASFFRKVLEDQTGALWQALTKEPVVRDTCTWDPEAADFFEADTPLLAVYRKDDKGSQQKTDDEQATVSQVCLLWVAPSLTQGKTADVHPFFNAWKKAIELAVQLERHQGWVHPDDAKNEAALFWGSSVFQHAGVDSWELDGGAKRTEVSIEVRGASPMRSDAYEATLLVVESTGYDETSFSTHPTVIDGRLVSSDAPETRIERQHFRTPPEPDP